VLFNSAMLTDRSGKLLGRYDKHVLLAFGEYLPFGDTFPVLYRWSPNTGKFTPGRTYDPLRLDDHAIATCICYDDIFPGFMISVVTSGPTDLLVNLTNDAWFGDTTEPWIHLALAQFRAIEHRRYFVRSTNSGVSAFIDPVGRVIAHTDTFQAQSLAQEIAWLHGRTPYELWGDIPWWLISLAIFAAGFVPSWLVRKGIPSPAEAPAIPASDEQRAFRAASREFLGKSRTGVVPDE
jgi:apolipoprotein N-acyltransferase